MVNPALLEAISSALRCLHPDYVHPEEAAREYLELAADAYREAGNRDAEKRTRRLLARLTPK